MYRALLRLGIVLIVAIALLATTAPASAGTFVVDTTDDLDDGRCDARHCSLREAIDDARVSTGSDEIQFDIPGSGPHVIILDRSLPAMTGVLTINGTSEPDYAGVPVIVLDGSRLGGEVGLSLSCEACVVRGLSLIGFSGRYYSAAITTNGGRVTISENYIGLAPSGAVGANAKGISLHASEAVVRDNVISGNGYGIYVWSGSAVIQGNRIGTNPAGTRSAAETSGIGIHLDPHAEDVWIGGESPEEGNLISGLSPFGIGISASPVRGLYIQNNRIGTNAAGDAALPNWLGIDFASAWCDTGDCGTYTTVVRDNVISGNLTGINANRDHALFGGNFIGTNAAGTAALGNADYGLRIDFAHGVNVGGQDPEDGNVISGNGVGILLEDFAQDINVMGNKIGTSASGDLAIPNDIGVQVLSRSQVIGGDEPGTGNLISGNRVGLSIETNDVIVRANWIGTDATGLAAIPNEEGIRVVGAGFGVRIDSAFEELGNVIAFNTSHGIHIVSSDRLFIQNALIRSNGGDGIFFSREPSISFPFSQTRMTENSIYDNGGLGIHFADAEINGGIRPPEITSASYTQASGTACHRCTVEVFVAEPDPSGFGEGRTYLGSTIAGTDGRFSLSMERVRACGMLTATATDAGGNTSEFSRAVSAGLCFRIAPLVALIALIGAPAGGSAFMIILHRRPLSLRTALWGLGGALGGLALAGAFLALPNVEIQRGQEGTSRGADLPPSCGQLLDESHSRPSQGQDFQIGTDVLLFISPLQGMTGDSIRWSLEAARAGADSVRSAGTSHPLSSFGFDPQRPGAYSWRAVGERIDEASGDWAVFCADLAPRTFTIGRPISTPQLPEPTPTPVSEPTATPTPTEAPPQPPMATFLQNANCREGPALVYDVVTSLYQGQTARVDGRSVEGTWWWIQLPGLQAHCWVAVSTVEVSGDTASVTVYEAPPEPVAACWVWEPQIQQNVCTAPCPPNAQPGGACMP
jgi:CSLREA domain-containing protein